MNDTFQRLMADATQLTRSGDLRAATAAIQAALGGATASTHAALDDTAVIEGEAREIKEDGSRNDAPTFGQFIGGTYADKTGSRDYKLFIPPGGASKPLPLVVMLHGCTQNPDDFALGTGMNDAALEQGFFVLYPAQTQNANASRCWNWFMRSHQQRDLGEPAILANMTREVITAYNVDPQRVYVAGLSAGGAMAAILGDAYPDLFAAVGVHSGLATGSAKDVQSAFAVMNSGVSAGGSRSIAADDAPRQTPPTIVFHGDQDTTVNPANGARVAAVSAAESASEIEQGKSENGRNYTKNIYRKSNGQVNTEHWVVHGAAHAWSGGSARGSYTDARGPSASKEMLRFFFAQTLKTALKTALQDGR